MLDNVHESHLGIEMSRSRARGIMFWPKMSQDIEKLISKCAVCQESRNRNQKEPLLPHEVPNRPWSKLGADTFQFEKWTLSVDCRLLFWILWNITVNRFEVTHSHNTLKITIFETWNSWHIHEWQCKTIWQWGNASICCRLWVSVENKQCYLCTK